MPRSASLMPGKNLLYKCSKKKNPSFSPICTILSSKLLCNLKSKIFTIANSLSLEDLINEETQHPSSLEPSQTSSAQASLEAGKQYKEGKASSKFHHHALSSSKSHSPPIIHYKSHLLSTITQSFLMASILNTINSSICTGSPPLLCSANFIFLIKLYQEYLTSSPPTLALTFSI